MTSSVMLSYVGYILSIWFAYRCLSFDQLFYMIPWSSWFKSDPDPQITRKRQSWDEILFCKFNLIVQKAIVHDFQWSLKASSLFKSHFKKWIWLIIDFDYQPISWMTQHIVDVWIYVWFANGLSVKDKHMKVFGCPFRDLKIWIWEWLKNTFLIYIMRSTTSQEPSLFWFQSLFCVWYTGYVSSLDTWILTLTRRLI